MGRYKWVLDCLVEAKNLGELSFIMVVTLEPRLEGWIFFF